MDALELTERGKSDSAEPNLPWTVEHVSAAAEKLRGFEFLADAPRDLRYEEAILFGGVHSAIRHLCPDLWASTRPIRIAVGGAVVGLTALSGRLLALYGKALGAPPMAASIWSERQLPPLRNVNRQFLLLPAAKMIRKSWQHAVKPDVDAPDVLLLLVPDEPEDVLELIKGIGETPLRTRTIIGGWSSAHAVLLRALLVEYGYTVSPVHVFGTDGEHKVAFQWHCCFEVHLEPDALQSVAPATISEWLLAAEDLVATEVNSWDLGALFDAIGRIRRIVSGADTYLCMMSTPTEGLCLDTGQFFNVNPSRAPGAPAIVLEDEYPVTGALLEEGRSIDAITEGRSGMGADEVRRYRAMCWLADVQLNFELESAGDDELTDGELSQFEFQPVRPVVPAGAPSLPSDSPPVEPTPPVPPVPPKAPRPMRLSRSAGTTEVLALAGILGGVGEPVTLERASGMVIEWLGMKGFPGLFWNTSEFASTADGEVSIETDGKTAWSVRYDDRRHMAQAAFWRVEMTLLALKTTCALSVRLSQLRSSGDAPDPHSGVPSVVVKLGRELGLWDNGARLLPEARRISTAAQVEWLKSQLLDPDRGMALVVVSSKDASQVDGTVDRLAARLLGLAHVVVIGSGEAWALSEVLPDRYGVYGNAVRVYRPRPGVDDVGGDHPLWTSFSGVSLSPSLCDHLAEMASVISLEHEDLEDRAPSFREVRKQLTSSRLSVLQDRTLSLASTVDEERARHQAVVDQLSRSMAHQESQIEELQTHVRGLTEEIAALKRERDRALDETRVLQREKREASYAWRGANDQSPAEGSSAPEADIPDNWDGLEDWVERNCAGRVVMLPSAIKACRESIFDDVPLAYRSLLLLANEYVDMRSRGLDDDASKHAFDEALLTLGVECSPVGTAVDSRQFKAAYRKMFEGEEIRLDMHLKRGAGFDPKGVFRVYFHYSEESQRVIVGHMPGHLTNRKTRNA